MLRPLTTLLMVASVVLTVSLFLETRQPPRRSDPLPVRQAFARRLRLEMGGLVVCLVGAGIGAMVISRRAKQEYRTAALRNMRTLVEGDDAER